MRQAEYAVRDSERLSDRDPDRDEARPERDGPQGRSGQEHAGPGSMDPVRLGSPGDDRKPGRCCPTNPDQQERVPRAGSGARAPLHASPVQDHCAAGGGQALKTRTALTAGGQTQASARTGSPDLVLADPAKRARERAPSTSSPGPSPRQPPASPPPGRGASPREPLPRPPASES